MPRALWLLIIGMAVNVTGSSLLWPLNTIYIHDHLGKTLTIAGFILMLNSAASVAGNLVGGILYDKIGGYFSILTGIIITALSLLGLTIWSNWLPYCLFFIISGFGSGIIYPSMYAMAGNVWPEGGRKSFNSIYVAQNAGVAIGSAIGGILASFSFQLIFAVNMFMYVLFFFIAFFMYKNIQVHTRNKQTSVLNENEALAKKNTKLAALIVLCFGYFLCWICYVQWQATISTHTQELNIPLSKYSLLWAVNGGLIVFGQPLITFFTKRFFPELKHQMVIGVIIFIISFIFVGQTTAFAGFLTAMIILTIGEMLVWPAVPTLADQLATKGKEGFYQGVINSTATAGRMVGPLLGGFIVDHFGMASLIPILLFLLTLSIFTSLFFDYQLKQVQKPISNINN
ncbi:MDR family MFS transporter [Niallia nealsonii]|uniref:MFS transporter n=1 Tax=Niallia nealsonii TaxID=115979 RepID=A0A2N0YYB8_9BACI|nr:MFS transporter [Niallia nealsonii]PKG22254.1 MFS transporter [Niallia nealsonii]